MGKIVNFVTAAAKGSVIKIALFSHNDAIKAINTFVKTQDFDLSVAPVATIGQEIDPKRGWQPHMMPCLIKSDTAVVMTQIPFTEMKEEIVAYALGYLPEAVTIWAYPDGFVGGFKITGDCYYCGENSVSLSLK